MKRHGLELNLLLKKQISLYDRFIALLRDQWDSITEYSLGSLGEISEKKEKLVVEIEGLENGRRKIIEEMARSLGVSVKGITLKKLIQSQSGTLKAELIQNRETLLAKIQTINNLNSQIKNLLDQSSLSLKKSLAFLHWTAEKAASPYSASGKTGEGNIQGRMLSTDV